MPAVASVSFDVRDKEFVALVGPSGCGKSTVLNMIAGLIRPSAGEIRLDDRPYTGIPPQVGYVFQKDTVFPWRTVSRNIALGLEYRGVPAAEREGRVRAAVRLVGLEGFEDAYPATLSGGMRQRVALGRALAVDPAVLLLDEPFGALDAITRERLHDELQEVWIKTGKTMIFVTHNVREAVVLGNRVLVFSHRPGRIVAEHRITLPRPRRVDDLSTAEVAGHIARDLRQAREAPDEQSNS